MVAGAVFLLVRFPGSGPERASVAKTLWLHKGTSDGMLSTQVLVRGWSL